MKTKLIDTNSLLYARRMVREINRQLRSGYTVYAKNYPHNMKVFSVVISPNHPGNIIVTDVYNKKISSRAIDFVFQNGDQICANRENKH